MSTQHCNKCWQLIRVLLLVVVVLRCGMDSWYYIKRVLIFYVLVMIYVLICASIFSALERKNGDRLREQYASEWDVRRAELLQDVS